MNATLCLDGKWEIRQAGSKARIKRWLPATVPGTVHTDLLANGKIDDPFFRMNELDQRWVEFGEWTYRRSFEVAAEFLAGAKAIYLDFQAVDTFATVRLNGKLLGRTNNMFHPWRYEVKKLLKAGQNQIEVEFASAPTIAEDLARKSKIKYKVGYYDQRNFIRKSQYSSGWDWGPRFMGPAIWRSVSLKAVQAVELKSVYAYTREVGKDKATLGVQVELNVLAKAAGRLVLELTSRTTGERVRKVVPVELRPGEQVVKSTLAVDDPLLWWPAGAGEQNLYDLATTLEIDGAVVERIDTRVGIRTVELVREKDSQGECFRFRVNGRDIFCKGANWVPGDSFLPRFTPERYYARVADAREANMNMLRIWGGGIYEDPAFYAACDELGLMVWQDFMFACCEMPEDKPILDSIKVEADWAVRALRNNACIVLWCGNNENQWGYDEWWPPRPKRYGEVIYDKILPAACKRLDPSRPYWPGSPFGGPKANDPNFGDSHVWSVWVFWKSPDKYLESPARFASEFGFQAMPPAKTVRAFTDPADRKLFSKVIDHHNKAEDGHAHNLAQLVWSFGIPRDLDEYTYLSQVLQGEAIKIGVEHWRRRWPNSAGALYWQLNDCWPVASWSAIDWYGRPKGLWYASKRFYAPQLVSLHPVKPVAYGPVDLELWVNNDDLDTRPVKLEVTAWRLDGKRLYRRVFDTRLPSNGATKVALLKYDELKLSDIEQEVVHVRMLDGRQVLSRNVRWFAPPRHVQWPDPKLRTKVLAGKSAVEIELTVERAARGIMLTLDRWDGHFSDNFFDMYPGEKRIIQWWPTAGSLPDAKAVQRDLKVRWVTPTAH